MSIQTSYSQATPVGAAGGLVDLSPRSVLSRINGEADGTLLFGMGVVVGSNAGVDVNLPGTTAVAADFEGIAMNGYTSEMDMVGDVSLKESATVGVVEYGKVWGRLKSGISPAYGEAVYLCIDATNKGLFTNVDGDTTTIPISGRFTGGKGTGDIAPIQLYNQSTVVVVVEDSDT